MKSFFRVNAIVIMILAFLLIFQSEKLKNKEEQLETKDRVIQYYKNENYLKDQEIYDLLNEVRDYQDLYE